MKRPYHNGEQVYYRGNFGTGAAGLYKILRALPIENEGRIRYCIKNTAETFERVAYEDQLSKEP